MPNADFERHLAEDARLIILRELSDQLDHRLNTTMLAAALYAFGHNRSRDWLETQIFKLAELGAVKADRIGTVLVVELLAPGLDHVQRRSAIAGVKRPSLGG
jgi:hypothetical protein